MAVSPDISFDVINGGSDASGAYNIKNTEIKIIIDTSNVKEANFQPNLVQSDIETGETYYKSNYINIDKLMSTYQMKEDKLSQYKIEGSDTFKVNNQDSKWFNYKYSDLWNSKNNAAVWHSRFLNSGKYLTDYIDYKYSSVIDKLLLPGCYPHFKDRYTITPDMNTDADKRVHYVKIIYNPEKLSIISYNYKDEELNDCSWILDATNFTYFNKVIPTKILIGLVGAGGKGGSTGFLQSGCGGGGGGTVVGVLNLTAVTPDNGNYVYYVKIGKTKDDANTDSSDFKYTDLYYMQNNQKKVIASSLGGSDGGTGNTGGSGGGTAASSYYEKYDYFYTICQIPGGKGGVQHTNGNRVYPRIVYCDGTVDICADVAQNGTLSNPKEPKVDSSKNVVKNELNSYIKLAEYGYYDSSTSSDNDTKGQYPGLGGRSGGTSCGGGGGASAFGRGGYGAWNNGKAGSGTGPGTGGGGGSASRSGDGDPANGQPGALYIWW